MTPSEWTTEELDAFKTWMKGVLKMHEVTVTFTKKDGTDRVMKCTLEPTRLPVFESSTASSKTRGENPDVQSVYDLEASGWRSFAWNSLKKVEFSF